MPVVTYHRPRRNRSNETMLPSSPVANQHAGAYRTLQTVFVICIALAAAFVVVLQYQSSGQLKETSIVATLENHDSSPQPTRPPTAVATQQIIRSVKDSSDSFQSVPHSPQQHYAHRLDRYCARHVPAGQNAETFTVKIAEQYDLVLSNLVVAIRHGDRSSIHALPNATMQLPKTTLVVPEAKKFTQYLSNLELTVLGDSVNLPKHNKGEDLTKALDPKVVFQRSDFTLPQGQLTSRGFTQHLELGQILDKAYGSVYLQNVVDVEQIYVRSTNYARTIQSVSALLMTSLPHLAQKSRPKKITIHTHADESQEIMHGVGLRSSSHGIQTPGQTSIESHGACLHAVTATKAERDHFTVTPSAVEPVITLFGDETKSLYPTEIVDTSIPSYCHQRPLPCAVSNDKNNLRSTSQSCIETAHLESLMRDADRYYCDRYSGSHGGYQSTRLSTYPFLHEVQEALLKPPSTPKPRLLSIFSGHDTVIAPVLASLGVFRSLTKHHRPSSYCHWPGYASRIVFERYSFKNKQTNARLEQSIDAKEISSLVAAAKQFWDEHHHARHVLTSVPSSEKAVLEFLRSFFHETDQVSNSIHPYQRVEWVRVVYNGDDITSMIPACLAERWIIAHVIAHHVSTNASSSSSSSELAAFVSSHRLDLLLLARRFFADNSFTLCSSFAFRQQIEDLIAPSETLSAACEKPAMDYTKAGMNLAEEEKKNSSA